MSFSHTISRMFFCSVILLLAGEVHSGPQESAIVVDEAVSYNPMEVNLTPTPRSLSVDLTSSASVENISSFQVLPSSLRVDPTLPLVNPVIGGTSILSSRWTYQDGLLVNCPTTGAPVGAFGDMRNLNGICFDREEQDSPSNIRRYSSLPVLSASDISAFSSIDFSRFDPSLTGITVRTPTSATSSGAGDISRFPSFSLSGYRDTVRDLRICTCLEANRNISLEGLVFGNGDTRNLAQENINTNIRNINSRITGEFNAMAFQASTLSGSDAGGQAFTDAYRHTYTPPLNDPRNPNRLPTVWSGVRQIYGSRAQPNVPSPDMEEVLTDPLPEPALFETRPGNQNYNPAMCIPQRHLRTMQQLPTDEETVNFLRQLPESFDPDAWDFNKLRRRLRDLSTNVRTLNQALENPEARQIHLKLQFLHSNGMVKNLFSANNQLPNSLELKRDLYNRMRQTFANSGRLESPGERFKAYRSMLVVFFGGGSPVGNLEQIQAMTQSGAELNMASLIAEIPSRAMSTASVRTPEEIFRDASAGTLLTTREIDVTTFGRAERDPEVYRNYCPRLRFAQAANQWTVIRELEDRFDANYSSTKSKYDGLQQSVCVGRRRAANGDLKTFAEFQRDLCSGMGGPAICANERHEQILARYLTEFPESESGTEDKKDVESLIPLLNGEVEIADNVDSGQSGRDGQRRRPRTRGQIANTNSVLTQIASETEDNTGMTNTTSRRNMNSSLSSIDASKARADVSASAQTQAAQQAQGQSAAAGIAATGALPLLPAIAQGAAAVPESEIVRTRVRQSDANLSRISEELSGLREELTAPGVTPESSQYRDIIERMAGLERSVEAERERNADLRRQLARAQAREAAASPEAIAARDEASSNPRPVARNPAAITPGGSQVEGSQIGSQSGAQASQGGAASLPFSPVSSFRQARSVIGGAVNGALLSRYGVQSVRADGGAIIVADSTGVDVNALRRDSVENTLQVSFNETEAAAFARDESGALNRLLSTAPQGEVLRVVITIPGSQAPVERFILRSEGKISIVPPPGTVSRAPASSQRYRLSDLVSELQTGR